MDVLEAVSELQLNLLPIDWVDNLWSNDFVGVNKVPDEYDLQMHDASYSLLMNNLAEAIDCWDKVHDSSFILYKKSWQTLIQNKVHYKGLLSLISVFLDTENKETIKANYVFALSSSRLYFALLSIPGSLACNIFNAILYDKALKTLTNVLSLIPKKSVIKKSKKKKHDKRDGDNVTVESNNELSEVEKQDVLRKLSNILDGLSTCLRELTLKDEDESVIQTIQTLVKMTQLEWHSNVFHLSPKSDSVGDVVLKSYSILEQLCNTDHGEVEVTIKTIMRFFLPTLVINEENVKMAGKNNFSSYDNTIVFISRLLSNFKEDAFYGVKAVVQQLCVRMPDKADIRAKAIPQIIQILGLLPYDVFEGLVQWIVSLAHSDSVKYRICAIEVIAKLLNVSDLPEYCGSLESCSNSTHNIMNISINYGAENRENKTQIKLLHKFLIGAILSRSLDASPVLRSKCLSIFGSLVLSNQSEIKEIMQELFVKPYECSDVPKVDCDEYFDFQEYFSTSNLSLPDNALPSGHSIMYHTELLTKDDKVFVRKNALQLISNVILLNKYWLSGERLEILVASSRDVSLMIRKMIVKSLTDILLLYPSYQTLIQSWVHGVVSLIADSDIKCQEKVIESVRSVILENLATYEKTNTPHTKLPWVVLSTIALIGKRILLKFACRTWSINKSITKKTFQSLQSHIGTENNFAAWFFIVCLTEFEDFPSPRLLADYFLENIHNHEAGETLSQLVVEAIFLNWKGFDSDTQHKLFIELKKSIESYSVPLFLISRYMDVCFLANKDETKFWSGHLVESSERYLKKYIAPGCSNKISDGILCCWIHTLGDAAHFQPGVSMDIINCLANIIDPTFIVSSGETNGKWHGSVSDNVKAVAIVALGKVCLQDHFIAKKYATVFATVLNEDSKTAVKVNAMAALTDLCVRFTSVVEDNLGDMCVMLKDNDIQVRTHSLKLILQLIQEDYLKPKGALFFYLLIMLRDPIMSVREIIEAFFTNMLLKRNPSIMCHYFIQAILFFNDYQGNGSYNKRRLTAKERKVFSMAGATNFYDRGQIYKYMLSNMRDDHRFKLSNRICVDILDEVNKRKIPLEKKGVAVLKDALFALACDEMRLENLRKVDDDSSDKETDEVGDIGGGEAVLGIAKKVFISQIVKANYVECIVPTITKLKRMLTELKSPLVRDLMICLRELMKDFRTEINDILHADPELAAEVALDLKDVSEEEDHLSDPFTEFNIREVRVQCEQLSEKALCEKMGIVTPMKKMQAQSISFLRPSAGLVTQIQLPSSMGCNLPVRQASPRQCLDKNELCRKSRSCSLSSLSSQHSSEDSSEIPQIDSHSLSPSFSSGGEEKTSWDKNDSPDDGNSTTGKKRRSNETFSPSPEGSRKDSFPIKPNKNVRRKKKK